MQGTSFFTLIPDYLRIKNFFKNSALSLFYIYGNLTFMQSSRKILIAFFEENYNGHTDKITWAITKDPVR